MVAAAAPATREYVPAVVPPQIIFMFNQLSVLRVLINSIRIRMRAQQHLANSDPDHTKTKHFTQPIM